MLTRVMILVNVDWSDVIGREQVRRVVSARLPVVSWAGLDGAQHFGHTFEIPLVRFTTAGLTLDKGNRELRSPAQLHT